MLRERTLTQSAILNVMIEACFKAGRGLVRDFGEIEKLQVSKKGLNDFVSTADQKAERIIKASLEKARPTFSYLMEESGSFTGEQPEHRWIVDPLDGTTNFLHGIPTFCISIAYEKNKEIHAGVIYDPLLDEMFWAEKNKGAFLNSKKILVSGRTSLKESLILTGFHNAENAMPETFFKQMSALFSHGATPRLFGSAALSLAYVACGRSEGYFENTALKLWDIAAGKILIEESKGIVSYTQNPNDESSIQNLTASSVSLERDLLKISSL